MLKYITVNLLLISSIFIFIVRLSAQSDDKYTNPILAGFYPDPSICRVGANYYLVNSTFAYFPGITIFKSKDLVHWNLIGHALNESRQLNLDSLGVSRNICPDYTL